MGCFMHIVPNEILFAIVEQLGLKDVARVASCCRSLQASLDPLIYRQVRDDIQVTLWAADRGEVGTLKKLLSAGADLCKAWDSSMGLQNRYPNLRSNVFQNIPNTLFSLQHTLHTPVMRDRMPTGAGTLYWRGYGCFPRSYTPLHLASQKGHEKVVEFLLQHTDDVDVKCFQSCSCSCYCHPVRRPRHGHYPSGTYEWTALHLAIYHGHLGSAVKLMEAGATFWVSPSRSPSFLVPTSTEDIQDGYYHDQGAALRAGTNPSHFSKSTALLSAAAAGNPSMVSAVLDRFDVFANNQSKHTALFNAYIHRSLDAFGLLLSRGANVESPKQPSNTILTFACASDNFTDASWLIKLGADVTRTNVRGLTPLNCLCSKLDRLMRTPDQDAGDLVKLRDTMEILLTTGADPNACVPSTLLPLAVAAIWCQIDIIKLLLDHNADINAQDTIGETALMTLCLTIPDRPAHKLIATAKFLLDQGALPGATASSETKLLMNILNIQTWHDQDIATLLELVAMRKLADETKSYMVNLLGLSFVRHRLQCCQVFAKYAGRCPNIGENKEMLDFAINDDYVEGLKFLLSLQGMNEIVRNPSRLYQACERGATKVADLLLRSGVPCTFVADGGWTCLHRACQKARDDLSVPELLLKQGCDPNHETDDSETPLLLAIKLRHVGLVNLLLDHGANPNHICEDGVHPMDHAHQLDYSEILGLLLRRNELEGAERAFWVRTLREERRNQGSQ